MEVYFVINDVYKFGFMEFSVDLILDLGKSSLSVWINQQLSCQWMCNLLTDDILIMEKMVKCGNNEHYGKI